MAQNADAGRSGGGAFNTLAQTGTGKAAIIQGRGSDLSSQKTVQGKAKRKMITRAAAKSMIDVAKRKGEEGRIKMFWNTFYCQNTLYTYEGRSFGKYCKNRHCLLCCAVRKAEIINRYLPELLKWEEPHFVTLTIKAVRKQNLSKFLKGVNEGFRIITARLRKRHQRGKSIPIIGIKSLECNFNPKAGTYNPHLHIIVPNRQTGELLIREWLEQWGRAYTSPRGQHISRIHSLKAALIETIKYGSKIFTEPDVLKKAHSKGQSRDLYAAALYNIFCAMKGIRIFDRFGFNLPEQGSAKAGKRKVEGAEEWAYTSKIHDWVNMSKGLVLSAFQPNAFVWDLLANRIDLRLE